MAAKAHKNHQLPTEALLKLGQTIQNKRLVRKIPALRFANQVGVSRSYLVRLEKGEFSDIGLEKFLRVTQALGLQPHQILQEAGLIPTPDSRRKLKPADFLRETYSLSPENIN